MRTRIRTRLKRFHARLFCAVALGIGSSFSLAAAAEDSAATAPAKTSQAIAWSQLGAKAGAHYQGDGLVVIPTADGARLRCVFQRLEAEATREGLWLTSTVTNAVNDRFRVMAEAVGREVGIGEREASDGVHRGAFVRRSYAPRLPDTGTVSAGGQTVRFIRPGMVEEFSVCMDGVRQDFVVPERPAGAGEVVVRLDVSGARIEPAADGARLVLKNSGRNIAYGRLRVTDGTGKELAARMEVTGHGESQRDSIAKPRVASLRATLGQEKREKSTLNGLRNDASLRRDPRCDATPLLGLKTVSFSTPGVGARRTNPGPDHAIHSGLNETSAQFGEMTSAESRGPALVVVVADADAVYPIRIDPTFSDAN
jgi:hypothetical protein